MYKNVVALWYFVDVLLLKCEKFPKEACIITVHNSAVILEGLLGDVEQV